MRIASSYRGARRNSALRELKTTWGGPFYHPKFNPTRRRMTVLSRKPSRYHPLEAVGRYLRSLGRIWKGRKAA